MAKLAAAATARNWQSQQQQQQQQHQRQTSDTDIPSLWRNEADAGLTKLMAFPTPKQWKREDQAGIQDVSNHSTEMDLASGTCGSFISNMEVDTHLGDKEFNTNAFLENEVVEEDSQIRTKLLKEKKTLVQIKFVLDEQCGAH